MNDWPYNPWIIIAAVFALGLCLRWIGGEDGWREEP
jgi:hypothetical protein